MAYTTQLNSLIVISLYALTGRDIKNSIFRSITSTALILFKTYTIQTRIMTARAD